MADRLDTYVDRTNQAAVWGALAAEFPRRDPEAVRADLKRVLKAPLTDPEEPWKDPARPRTEALVELLLLWQVPEMATDLLVEAPGRIKVGLLMRALRAHSKKDPTTARALAASMVREYWNDLSWLDREETPRMAPPPPPGGEGSSPSWAWTLPDPLAETDACLAALDAMPVHERQRIIGGMYRSPGGAGSPVSNF